MRYIQLKFIRNHRIITANTNNIELSKGDYCLVEWQRGDELCIALHDPLEYKGNNQKTIKQLNKIIEKRSPEDVEALKQLLEDEKIAHQHCKERIKARNLPMNLVLTNYTFSRSKLIFYFTADGRIDFRELVKDLAFKFKTRIEMRQIGVRDRAKLLGGFAPCGRELCCCNFLHDFEPVSIRMAKDQELSLIPSKISGICGRLMCCLTYEYDYYMQTRKQLPRIGKQVKTSRGYGKVTGLNLLKETIVVELSDGNTIELDPREITIEYARTEKIEEKVNNETDSG